MQPELERPTTDALAAPLPSSELLGLGLLVFAFASLVTIHVALAYRVGSLGPRWRGVLAFAVPPLAPIWGVVLGLRLLPGLWMVSALGYLIALVGSFT